MDLKRLDHSVIDDGVSKKSKVSSFDHVNLSNNLAICKKQLTQAWEDKRQYMDEVSSLHHQPFTHCSLDHFIDDDDFVNDLQTELMQLSFKEKNNDLYKFRQSSDLKGVSSPCIDRLKDLLYKNFHSWLGEVTSIQLSNNVDIFCSQYNDTDILLCHDDELEGRRIAFILYLVPSTWQESHGGLLHLFNMDEFKQPKQVVKSICPKRNTMLFFEVTEASYHQVSEILCTDDCRLSVSGWFHGTPVPARKQHIETPPTIMKPNNIDGEEFYAWINPMYLDPEIQAQIKDKFENNSEIELQDFLQEDKYNAVVDALRDSKVLWSKKGPPNKRNYNVCLPDNCPSCVVKCLEFLTSDAMFLILSNLTGLKLHKLAASSDTEDEAGAEDTTMNAGYCSQVRRWKHDSYTLIHDSDPTQFTLDTLLYFGCTDWETVNGGCTTYIAKGEDEELLTICPLDNSLALVYRDEETLRFVKHINHTITKAAKAEFYDIATAYYE